MRKILMIVTSIVLIVTIVGLLWWYDDTRIIEEPIDIVKSGQNAFQIKDTGDTVILTGYDDDIPRTITTFYFKEGFVDHCKFERVYKNKLWARGGMNEDFDRFYDRELNINVVSGKIDISIGESYEGFSQMLIDAYSKSWVIVD